MKEQKTINGAGLVLSGCFLLLGAYLTLSSFSLPAGSGGYPGAGFFPRVLGIVILVLAVLLVCQTLLGGRVAGIQMGHGRMVAGVAALTLVYLLLWGTGIFALRTFVFVAIFLRFLGQPWKTGLTVSAVLTACVTAAFQYGLNLSLD